MNRFGWILVSLLAAAVSARADILWVANAGAGNVSVIDTSKANRVVAVIALGAGSVPVEVAINAFVPEVYVADAGRASLWVLSYVSKVAIAEVPLSIVAPFGLAVMPLGEKVYVGNADGGTTAGIISCVDTRTRRETRTIDISTQGLVGIDMALTPVSATRLYIACNGTDTMAGLNTATNALLGAPFPVAFGTPTSQPFAIGLRPDNGFVYVCDDDGAGNVAEIVAMDVPTLTPTIIPMGAGQRCTDIAFHPTRRRAYVPTGGGRRVRILETTVNTFIADVVNLPAGAIPAKAALNERGTLGMFTEQAGAGACIFQTMANLVQGGVIATGATPFGCAIAPITSDPAGARVRQRQQRGRRGGGLF